MKNSIAEAIKSTAQDLEESALSLDRHDFGDDIHMQNKLQRCVDIIRQQKSALLKLAAGDL